MDAPDLEVDPSRTLRATVIRALNEAPDVPVAMRLVRLSTPAYF
jgi:hypothetical protein